MSGSSLLAFLLVGIFVVATTAASCVRQFLHCSFDWFLRILSLKGGFKFVVKYTRNCDGTEQIIKLINSSVVINEQCEVFSTSCSEIKPYNSAMVMFIICWFASAILKCSPSFFKTKTSVSRNYNGLLPVFQKETDLCDSKAKKSEPLKVGLAMFGVPLSCSFNQSKVFCYRNEKVLTFSDSTLRLFKIFPLSGSTAITKLVITHDVGQSCFETETEIIKE